jgi:predicted nucleic acid-binding protein
MSKVVVDASIALRWVLRDEKEARVDALLEQWATSLTEMLVPPLFLAEVTNALYLSVKRKRLTLAEADLALRAIMELGIQVAEPSGLYPRSLRLAVEYAATNAYDTQYVALAEMEGCDLWTADERLAASMKPLPSCIKLV